VNGKPVEQYFPVQTVAMKTMAAFTVMGGSPAFDAIVSVAGGGFNGQAEAVRHGIARALVEQNADNKPVLKKAKLLTRDSRIKERKKYGLLGARKATHRREVVTQPTIMCARQAGSSYLLPFVRLYVEQTGGGDEP